MYSISTFITIVKEHSSEATGKQTLHWVSDTNRLETNPLLLLADIKTRTRGHTLTWLLFLQFTIKVMFIFIYFYYLFCAQKDGTISSSHQSFQHTSTRNRMREENLHYGSAICALVLEQYSKYKWTSTE